MAEAARHRVRPWLPLAVLAALLAVAVDGCDQAPDPYRHPPWPERAGQPAT